MLAMVFDTCLVWEMLMLPSDSLVATSLKAQNGDTSNKLCDFLPFKLRFFSYENLPTPNGNVHLIHPCTWLKKSFGWGEAYAAEMDERKKEASNDYYPKAAQCPSFILRQPTALSTSCCSWLHLACIFTSEVCCT